MPVAEERGVTKARAKTCPCEACKKGRGAPSKVAPLDIHSYSSAPRGGWQKQQARTELVTPTLFMGVELETSVSGNGRRDSEQARAIAQEVDRQYPREERPAGILRYTADGSGYSPEWLAWSERNRRRETDAYMLEERLWREGFGAPKSQFSPITATAEEAVSLAEPVGFWHAKHDGSVSGPEFASQPASLEYWYSIKRDLDLMFTSLLHAGVRSHTGDEAGMHISISLESFQNSDHLFRFARLINGNPRWSQKMSQRTEHSMHWCQLGTGTFGPGRDAALNDWAVSVMRTGYDGRNDRYCALNSQCGDQGRLEFRLPRGTLRLDRFYKNLEWVAAMIEFTANFAATDSATFMRWVMANRGKYEFLQGWFSEKFGLSVTDAEFLPELAHENPNAVANLAAQNGYSSYDDRMCECGDGCERGYCASCDEEEFEPEPYGSCGTCGMYHDQPIDSYQRYVWGAMPRHMHYDHGDYIGPERQYREDGSEYQYDPSGNIIRTEEEQAAEDARRQAAEAELQRQMDEYRNAVFTTQDFAYVTLDLQRISFEPIDSEV